MQFAFREIFDAAPDALIIVDAHGRIAAVSARARELFGESVATVVGQPLEVLVPERHRTEHELRRDEFLAAPEVRRMGKHPRMTARRLDGMEIPVDIALSPLETAEGRFVMCAVRDASDRVRLEERSQLLAALVAGSDDAILAADRTGLVTECNAGAEQLYGYSAAELVGRSASMLAPTEAIVLEQDRMREAVLTLGHPVRFETKRQRKDGSIIDVAVRYSPIAGNDGEVAGYSIIARDITERLRMVAELRLRARLLDAVDAGVIATDLQGTVRYWNGGSERLSGWSSHEVVGRHITAFSRDPKTTEVMAHIQRSGSWEGMLSITRKQGRPVPGFVRGVLWLDEDGRPAGMIAAAVDMADRLAMEEDLRAARDFLAAITENIGEGLMVIDDSGRIDFANEVAARMLGLEHPDLLGTRITSVLDAETTGEVLTALQPAEGVARVDTHHATCADGSQLAVDITSSPMHQPGARRWALVMADDTERRARITELERELDELGWIGRIGDALNDDALVLLGQPIVRITSGEVCHHELLVRLRSADGSLLSPGQFLPAAERHGLITDIDRWVVDRAIELAAKGRRVAVNLSAATLTDEGAPSCIADRVRRSGVDPASFMFEITETAVLGDLHAGQNFVKTLAELGYQVALDDFGTGYGGFTYLKHLPVGVLKIDAEFVRDLDESPASQHVIRAIVGLAQSFGLETIAEGVEDEATLQILGELGVDLAQGYHLGRPEPI